MASELATNKEPSWVEMRRKAMTGVAKGDAPVTVWAQPLLWLLDEVDRLSQRCATCVHAWYGMCGAKSIDPKDIPPYEGREEYIRKHKGQSPDGLCNCDSWKQREVDIGD